MILILCLCAGLPGCSRFRRSTPRDTVYVSARQSYLHDRVAAVSNRVAQVANGQKLQVLERNRRFLRVKTEQNQTGWIEEHSIIDAKTYDAFRQLSDQHRQDPVVSRATLRDDLYMHIQPGRATEHFYLLAGESKVELLARASVVRTTATGKPVTPPPTAAAADAKPGDPAPQPEAPPKEDWWLARDGQGHTGWLLGGRLDVDVPDEIGVYAEGQRIVGAWALAKITDPEANSANHQVYEYLTILAPPKSGLPFDFDQVRVFTWSMKHHRYETAFRLRGLQGYLPVRVTPQPEPGKPATFSFEIAGDSSLASDANGVVRPVHPRTLNFQLTDTRVQRIGPDFGPIPNMNGNDKDKKNQNGKKPAKRK